MSRMGTCGACRFQVPWGASKCGHCGQSLTWESETGSEILGAIFLLFIVAGMVSMCSPDKSGGKSPNPPVTNSSNKDPAPKWTVPDEDTAAKKPQWIVPNEAPQAPQPQPVINSVEPQTEPPKQWTVPKED